MSGQHDIYDILDRIDAAIEVATVNEADGVETVESTRRSELARPIAEATGMDVIVVRGNETDDAEALAVAAARAAAAAFLPGVVRADLEGGSK